MAVYRQIIGMAPSEAKWRDRMAALEVENAKMRKESVRSELPVRRWGHHLNA